MSDVLVMVYLIVATGLVTVFVFHKATGHRRIFSVLMVWALLGVLVSTLGGLLILGTFTPNMASYNNTAADMYNIFTWGGVELPEYDTTLAALSNLGIVINAMGLGILVMTTMAGFLPRSFFSLPSNRKAAVEKAVSVLDGVQNVDVDLAGKKATVNFISGKTTADVLKKTISDLGYIVE